jgi:hypothetical protein
MTLSAPRRLVGAVVAVLLLAAAAVASTAAVAPAKAEAATSMSRGYLLVAGPHLSRGRGHEWMGSYSIDGRPQSYCIDYGKATPRAVGYANVRTVPGWTAERAARISYILSKWGDARTNTTAAAVNASINLLIGNAAFTADWKSSYSKQLAKKDPKVNPLVSRMLDESYNLRGPYKIGVKVTRTAAVGGTAQARISVLSARNKPIANAPIAFRLGNAMPAKALPRRTAANGTAVADLVPSAPGNVKVSVTVSALTQTGVIRLSHASAPNVQRTASSAAATVSASGAAQFASTYPAQALKASMVCTQDCLGAPPVKVSATNASARNKLQVFLVVDGKTVPGKVLTLAPGKAGSFSQVVRDGQKVSMAYRWQQGKAWTRFIAYGTAVVVECPPSPDVDFTVDCPCDGEIDGTINDNNTTRYTHVITVEIPNKPAKVLTVAAKKKGSLAKITWKRGDTVTVWNQSVLAGKNVGPRIKVTTINFG